VHKSQVGAAILSGGPPLAASVEANRDEAENVVVEVVGVDSHVGRDVGGGHTLGAQGVEDLGQRGLLSRASREPGSPVR